MLRLGWQDRDKVYAALIAALHALRDWLPRDEAIYIGAYFPPLLRGLYFEGCTGYQPRNQQYAQRRLHSQGNQL
jgi:uncharacterized protein (DUF2267 family)